MTMKLSLSQPITVSLDHCGRAVTQINKVLKKLQSLRSHIQYTVTIILTDDTDTDTTKSSNESAVNAESGRSSGKVDEDRRQEECTRVLVEVNVTYSFIVNSDRYCGASVKK